MEEGEGEVYLELQRAETDEGQAGLAAAAAGGEILSSSLAPRATALPRRTQSRPRSLGLSRY